MLVFEERGKPEKNLSEQSREDWQQTQPNCHMTQGLGTESGTHLVGGERSPTAPTLLPIYTCTVQMCTMSHSKTKTSFLKWSFCSYSVAYNYQPFKISHHSHLFCLAISQFDLFPSSLNDNINCVQFTGYPYWTIFWLLFPPNISCWWNSQVCASKTCKYIIVTLSFRI